MMDEQDQNDTILFMSKNQQRKRLRTQAPYNDFLQEKFVPKWQHNTFYHDIKRKIHEKLKTQPPSESLGLFKNKKINISNDSTYHKPKSKITVSTLQIAIDPLQRKVQPIFQIQRKIYHQVQATISMVKTKPTKIARNMSAKIVRDPPSGLTNSSRSLQKKELIQTCRKNSKVETNLMDKKPSKQLFFGKQKQNQTQKCATKQSQEQENILKAQYNPFYMNRLRKSKSQKLKQQKSLLKIQTFDTDPLLFYFKVKNTFQPSNRQLSIKKLRTRIKTNQAFVGAP